jgi:hypothetical protein
MVGWRQDRLGALGLAWLYTGAFSRSVREPGGAPPLDDP